MQQHLSVRARRWQQELAAGVKSLKLASRSTAITYKLIDLKSEGTCKEHLTGPPAGHSTKIFTQKFLHQAVRKLKKEPTKFPCNLQQFGTKRLNLQSTLTC